MRTFSVKVAVPVIAKGKDVLDAETKAVEWLKKQTGIKELAIEYVIGVREIPDDPNVKVQVPELHKQFGLTDKERARLLK